MMCQVVTGYPENKPMRPHPYHLVDRSAWPILTAFAVFFSILGVVLGIHHVIRPFGLVFFLISLSIATALLFFWWGDVIRESFQGYHTEEVAKGLRLGFILFIASEVMFFFSFFWGFFTFLSPRPFTLVASGHLLGLPPFMRGAFLF